MGKDLSRRNFLKAGLALPAAGIVSKAGLNNAFGEPRKIKYRTLGKTGL